MKEQRKMEEKHLAQQPPWILNYTYFGYEGQSPNNNNNEKKICYFYSMNKNINIPKKLTQKGQRSW